MTSTPAQPQQERRAEIIDAAMRAFARKGYGGSTLADIAAEAGVSQPRISQIFGNKENAFLAAHRKAANEVMELLATIGPPFTLQSLGADYREMLDQRREVLLMIFQGLASSYVPSIGRECRKAMNEMVEIVVRAGGTPHDARILFERGLFVHAMLASGALEYADDHPPMGEMLETIDLP